MGYELMRLYGMRGEDDDDDVDVDVYRCVDGICYGLCFGSCA